MATITIENVPDSFVEKHFRTTFSFEEVKIAPKKVQKDPTIALQALMDDPENTSYGPFEWEEINNFLKSLMK